jgi:FixJ family two-component response regulator
VTSDGPYVAVVDDEASVRTALGRLLRLADYEVTAFASGEAFRGARHAPS